MPPRRWSFALLLTLIAGSAMAEDHSCAGTFDQALDRHLTAIHERDLPAYLSTLPAGDSLRMILPDGTVWETREAIAAGHEAWFADTTWQFDLELLQRKSREQVGQAIYRVQVNRPQQPGKPFLLTLVFARDGDGCWRLFHDQNTLLPAD